MSQPSNGFEFRRKRTCLWENENIKNLSKLLGNEVILRKSFFGNYSSLLRKYNFLPNGTPIKKITPHDKFVHPNQAKYYNEQKFQSIKSDSKEFYSKIFSMTMALSGIVEKSIKYKVFELGDTFQICDRCKKIISGISMPKCRCGNNLLNFQTYKIPNQILHVWINSPERFIEALCYNSIIDSNIPTIEKVNAGTEIFRKDEGPFQPETELDVSVIFKSRSKFLKNRNDLVILCSTDPTSQREKKQVEKIIDKKMSVIFVTTASKMPERIEKNVLMSYTKIDTDSNFPNNMIEYIRNLKFD